MYDIKNWYWAVAGSTTQVYSSASASYVSMSDATYAAWLAAGNIPTHIHSESDLAGVFNDGGCPQCWYGNSGLLAIQALLAGGLTITSTGTPAISGTYSTTPTSIDNVTSVSVYVNQNGTFPNGASTFAWADMSGTVHTFPNVASFKAFATAIANFVAAIEEYVNTGVGSLPSNSVTIA